MVGILIVLATVVASIMVGIATAIFCKRKFTIFLIMVLVVIIPNVYATISYVGFDTAKWLPTFGSALSQLIFASLVLHLLPTLVAFAITRKTLRR